MKYDISKEESVKSIKVSKDESIKGWKDECAECAECACEC